jgi:putative thioredoxin
MVIDVTEASFAHEVLEGSLTTPVIVDFWAAWCAPCRALGPVLEQAVESHPGEVVLAKVDVDANPRLQQRYGVRGIPAVKAFRNGQVVAEFTGAQARPAVERFVEALLPSPAERLTQAGDEASLRRAVELDSGLAAPRVALARLLMDRGETEAATEVLTPAQHDPVAAGLLARLQVLRRSPPSTRSARVTRRPPSPPWWRRSAAAGDRSATSPGGSPWVSSTSWETPIR